MAGEKAQEAHSEGLRMEGARVSFNSLARTNHASALSRRGKTAISLCFLKQDEMNVWEGNQKYFEGFKTATHY